MNSKLIFFIPIFFLFFFFLSLVLPKQTLAIDFYVATNGSDSNPGTLNQPWRTINYATSNTDVKGGDTIYIRGGTYAEDVSVTISGEPGKPITIRNYLGETPVITNDSNPDTFKIRIDNQSHIHIEGLHLKDYSAGGIYFHATLKPMTDLEVKNCRFENQFQRSSDGAAQHALYFVATTSSSFPMTHITAENNYFLDIHNVYISNSNTSETLTATGHVRYVKFINNTLENIEGIGIDIIGRPSIGQPTDFLIANNVLKHVGYDRNRMDSAIYNDGCLGPGIIENNFVLDSNNPYTSTDEVRGMGITVGAEDPGDPTENIIIRKNVVTETVWGIKMGSGFSANPCSYYGDMYNSVAVHNTTYLSKNDLRNAYLACGSNFRWKNNILVYAGSVTGAYQYRYGNTDIDPSTLELDYNIHWTPDSLKYFQWQTGNPTSLSAFQSLSSKDQHSFSADPMFVNINARNFHLQSTSPAIDAGGPLTTTRNSSSSGATVLVNDARYFSDGMGLQDGDLIRIGSDIVRVMGVNYDTNTLTIDRNINWTAGEWINYDFQGNGPDIGAFEYGDSIPQPSPSPSFQPSDYQYTVLKAEGIVTIDANLSEYTNANQIIIDNPYTDSVGTYKLLWDNESLYIGANVSDPYFNAVLTTEDSNLWEEDSLEFVVDTLHNGGITRDQDDYKFFVNLLNTHRDEQGTSATWDGVYQSQVILNGTNNNNQDQDINYIIEVKIPWTTLGVSSPTDNTTWGMDLALNDKDSSGLTYQSPWANTNGGSFNEPSGWGNLIFSTQTVSSCPGDLTSDNQVNHLDLKQILSSMFQLCLNCQQDLFQDNFINSLDLGFVINEWGSCE